MEKSASIRVAGSQFNVFVTKSADRSDKRDEGGELETAIYVVIYCYLPLGYTLNKKVKIKLEELIEKKTVF